jgi:CRISPR/Cas system-associated exonuclease Cas4 (RecB family)
MIREYIIDPSKIPMVAPASQFARCPYTALMPLVIIERGGNGSQTPHCAGEVEKHIEVEAHGVKIKAEIDCVEGNKVVEVKRLTSKTIPLPLLREKVVQLAIYAYAMRGYKYALRFVTPDAMVIDVELTEEEVADLARVVEEQLRKLRDGFLVYKLRSCESCIYKKLCPFRVDATIIPAEVSAVVERVAARLREAGVAVQ